MSGDFLGSTVENGELRFLSVSSIEKGDPRGGGCFRWWHYRYVLKIKDALNEYQKKAQEEGVALHDEIAHYLLSGDRNGLSGLVMKGMHFIPDPGPDLKVNWKYHRVEGKKIVSLLDAGGVPLVGEIDCAHNRGFSKNEGEITQDPPGTVEVIDWKRKGNAKTRDGIPTYKHANEMITNVQMVGYGELVRRTYPLATHVRLSHGNFFVKGSEPKKITKLHVIDDTAKAWEYYNGLGRTFRDVAREPDVEKVPGNKNACNAFFGCPHRNNCSTYRNNALDGLFGKVANDFAKETNMGLLGTLNMQPPPAPQQVAPPPMQPAPPPQPDLRAQLAQEESQLRAAQVQQQILPGTAPAAQPDLVQVWHRIQAHGRGAPGLAGAAAQALAQATGVALGPNGGFAGTGQIGRILLHEVAHIYQICAELDASSPTASTPTDVPPTLTTVDSPNLPRQQAPAPVMSTGLLPPDAPASNPVAATASTAPEAPKKRGRPKKETSDDATPVVAAVAGADTSPAMPASAPLPPPSGTAGVASSLSSGTGTGMYVVYVDCLPAGEAPTSLHAYIDSINAQLSAMYCANSIRDIRCAPQDSPLGFGKWKGALHEVVRTNPPPLGCYYLDTRGNELAEVVADAMRAVCSERGGRFIRGIR